MTPQDHDVIFSLVVAPGRRAAGSKEDVLRHFGTTDGAALGIRLLGEAIDDKSPVDLEAALIVCGVFGTRPEHLRYLVGLLTTDWHEQHETIVTMLADLRSPDAIDALYHVATWVPEYQDWNEARPLASKAIWVLGATPGEEAERALIELSKEPDEVVREGARAQLERRRRGAGTGGH
jgi:HEAT repeat protein